MVPNEYNDLLGLKKEELVEQLGALALFARDESSRISIGNKGAIEAVTPLLARAEQSEEEVDLELRLFANLVADNDKNRARAVAAQTLPVVCRYLGAPNADIRGKAVIAIYNLLLESDNKESSVSDTCVQNAISCKAAEALVDMLALHGSSRHAEYVFQLLTMIFSHTSSNPKVTSLAVVLSIQVQKADLASQLDCITAILSHQFGETDTDPEILSVLLSLLYDAHHLEGMEEELDDLLAARQRYLEKILSFSYERGVSHCSLEILAQWAKGRSATDMGASDDGSLAVLDRLQECACLIFGNQIRNDAQAIQFVQSPPVRIQSLTRALQRSNDWSLVHAVAGLMKNLSLPIENKKALGDIGLLEACHRLLKVDAVPVLIYLGASLIRSLCNKCDENITRILHTENDECIFADILRCSKLSDECGKWEASRTIVLVVKYLHQSSRKEGFAQLDVFDGAKSWAVVALLEMSKDARWEMIRLEALLGLALLAADTDFRRILRTHEGTESCQQILNDNSVSPNVKENAQVLLARLDES